MSFDRDSAAQSVRASMAPLVQQMAVMRPFEINGRTFTAQDLVQQLVVDPGRLDEEMARASAWIGFWGVLSADAKHLHDAKQAAYRAARDTWGRTRRAEHAQAKASKAKDDKVDKLTEASLDEEWRTTSGYTSWYEQLAIAERAWSCAQFLYEAHLRRSNMLSSLGKVYGDERALNNPATPRPRLT